MRCKQCRYYLATQADDLCWTCEDKLIRAARPKASTHTSDFGEPVYNHRNAYRRGWTPGQKPGSGAKED